VTPPLPEAMAAALDQDRDCIRRLRYANTIVRLGVDDTDEHITLLLDRDPAAISYDHDVPEIEIAFTAEQAALYAQGRLHLPSTLERGALRASGPLRKYLEVEPIIRSVLAELADGNGPGTAGPLADHAPEAGPLPTDLLAIETRDLHKAFGPRQILRGVDLTVPEGVISIVVGPSGTGKSVLLNHVIGLMRPDTGDVLVRGRALSEMSREQILKLRLEVGVMFQDGALFSGMNLFDNVAFPLRQHTDCAEDEVREIVMQHLDRVGLTNAVDKRPAEISGGMRKRAGLARAMVLDPGIVICDEPDSGLDPVRTALLGDLLAEQHAEVGGTMLVITHNIALARKIGEHVSVLWQGEILESGSAERVFESETPFVRQFLTGETVGPLTMDAS